MRLAIPTSQTTTERTDTINTDFIKDLTENEALYLIVAIENQFGWAGTTFTREDAEREWQNQQYDPETGLTPDTPMPDEAWELVQQQWEWRKGLGEILSERGWELVTAAVANAILDYTPSSGAESV